MRALPACGGEPPMSIFLASVGFGIVTAAVLAIASMGFTVEVAVGEVLKLAEGGVMIAGAFVAYLVNEAGVSIWLAIVGAAMAGAVLSVFLNRAIYTPFQRRGTSPITLVIVSLGMALVIEFVTQAIAGPTNVSYAMNQGRTLHAGGLQLTLAQLVIIAMSVAAMLGIHALLRYTRTGNAMPATAPNPTPPPNPRLSTYP